VARYAIYSPINRRHMAPGAPFAGSIRPPGHSAQIDVLRNCVFRRKYCQNVTVSPAGYPRGYITEPQLSSFRPSACPPIYPGSIPGFIPGPIPRSYPWVHSWTYPRVYPWTRCDSNCLRYGLGETTRLNVGALRPRRPQSLPAPASDSAVVTRTHPSRSSRRGA